MKGTTINRMLGTLKRRPRPTSPTQVIYSDDDSPEATAIRNITLFCESGKPGQPGGSDEEVLYLPMVVDACESSPLAAKEAAYLIRKFLDRDYYNRPHMQYNSVMLIRILAENPGPTFTRNLDSKFVQTVKELLRYGQDQNIRSLLVETLNKFSRDRAYFEGIELLVEMWGKEQEKMRWQGASDMYRVTKIPMNNAIQQQGYAPPSQILPSAQELSLRIMEARTSASLLSEVTESTPISEIINNELIYELVNRCQNANLSIQTYISARNPAPDNDVMENLIETNDMINNALSKHQRTLLQARKNQEMESTAGLNSRNGTSSRPKSKEDSSMTPPREDFPTSSTERLNGYPRPGIENPFSNSRSSLHSTKSSAAGSDKKYMMHAGGSDSISSKEKQKEATSNTPIYRY
ncbi:putative gat domain-containing protein [Erysiphe necator]|uniref:Putative gat domain-containing protein n=1 Tax=Uncinula necator TaxID=52586 RepID=A0A0B1P008_UNCNE|nr:putative gat domain-containing protein [Erysiphe necator]